MSSSITGNISFYILINNLTDNSNIPEKPTISTAFNSDWINAMADMEREYSGENYISHLFITVDPSATRERSDYVITSMFYVRQDNSSLPLCVVCIITLFYVLSFHSIFLYI